MKEVALIGYSGHAFVVADILDQSGYKLIGYFEKKEMNYNPMHLNYLGFEEEFNFEPIVKKVAVFPAVGDNYKRKIIMEFITARQLLIAEALSNKANISRYSCIGLGTLVCPGVCVNPYAIVGNGVILNTGSIIEHNCIIDNYVHIAPGAVLAGNVHIGESSFIGANAFVKQGVKIGNNVTIGAGAIVLKDIADNEIWIGNPAKRLKK